MKKYSIVAIAVLSAVALTLFSRAAHTESRAVDEPTQPKQEEMSKAEFDNMMKSLSNWGRWGKQDQLGALNLITPEKRRQAAKLVKSGDSISLAHNMITEKIGISPPAEHHMILTGSSGAGRATDAYSFPAYHGFTLTHIDALCHMFYQGQMYNGFPEQDVTDKGAASLSIITMKNGIFTRGLLMDFPRLFGIKYLKINQAIYPKDLDAWEKKTGVKILSGDAVFIRTGRWARWQAEGVEDSRKLGDAGLHISCMPWFKKRDIAVLATDVTADVSPTGVDDNFPPVHHVTIAAMGVPIIDNCDLEAVGDYAAAHHRLDFLVTVDPLTFEGGTGSPVNPTATF